ncbi:hypothetical protein B0H16DRAFT_1549688 [Mycena metata]|uniref:Uncharacterized protein n=1 Tax=Mycena metata TaxID=1033252 RepID=A0AAD7IU71_9AGAR|nr:hypothetical protein B0H16DRAFT_1549688 [Mycena metata]
MYDFRTKSWCFLHCLLRNFGCPHRATLRKTSEPTSRFIVCRLSSPACASFHLTSLSVIDSIDVLTRQSQKTRRIRKLRYTIRHLDVPSFYILSFYCHSDSPPKIHSVVVPDLHFRDAFMCFHLRLMCVHPLFPPTISLQQTSYLFAPPSKTRPNVWCAAAKSCAQRRILIRSLSGQAS